MLQSFELGKVPQELEEERQVSSSSWDSSEQVAEANYVQFHETLLFCPSLLSKFVKRSAFGGRQSSFPVVVRTEIWNDVFSPVLRMSSINSFSTSVTQRIGDCAKFAKSNASQISADTCSELNIQRPLGYSIRSPLLLLLHNLDNTLTISFLSMICTLNNNFLLVPLIYSTLLILAC